MPGVQADILLQFQNKQNNSLAHRVAVLLIDSFINNKNHVSTRETTEVSIHGHRFGKKNIL